MDNLHPIFQQLCSAIMPKRTPVKKSRGKRRVSVVRDRKYMDWLHDKPCAICGYPYSSPAHTGKTNGMRSKAGDDTCAPLCEARQHHAEFDRGRAAFEKKYGVDMQKIAAHWYALFKGKKEIEAA